MNNKCCKCGDDADFEVNGKNFCTKHILEYLGDEEVDTLQELIDQTKTPTEEEIIKEWEALDYELNETEREIVIEHKIDSKIIFIDKKDRDYYCDLYITFQEHQLITKTFKWLEVRDDK